jgi:uncharacterized protein (DUF1501 family)
MEELEDALANNTPALIWIVMLRWVAAPAHEAATYSATVHGDIKTHGPLCRATDQPLAGLLKDLKQRGLLDETLVVWTSEFGRSPWSQNTTGRDHNPKGYSSWLAGGGVKGGVVHGATDDVGYKAVDNPHYCSDLHATICRQLGLDHKKMEIQVSGVTRRLVEEDAPINDILA